MRYRYYSRSARLRARKGRRNALISIILIIFLIYATVNWILPNFIGGVGFITEKIKPTQFTPSAPINETLAPPVLNIPYEATNTAQVNIAGFATSHSKVELFIDDHKVDTAQAEDSGQFEFRDVSLNLGRNNIYGKTVDDGGVESLPSKNLVVFYDNDKPELTVDEPSDGKTIQGGDKKVTFRGKTEPNVNLFINDIRIILSANGSFSSDQTLNEGDNNFTIRAVDQAGNSTEVSRKVTYKP